MSEFSYTQLPPDGTGKRVAAEHTVEVKYNTLLIPFSIGDSVTTSVSGMIGNIIKVKGSPDDEIYVLVNKFFDTNTLVVGESIKIDGVNAATYESLKEDVYTQNITIAGGDNTLNVAAVTDAGALVTTTPAGDFAFDAFGKLMTSETTTIREYQPTVDTMPDEFFETTTLGSTITWDDTVHVVEMMTPSNNNTAIARRRTNLYHKYQTAVGTTVIFSAYQTTPQVGSTRRVGLFDDGDGLYFEAQDVGINVVIRSSVSGSVVETKVAQEDWNVDRLDGSGDSFNLSRVQLDPTKVQVLFIDYQWLGAGRVRFGFVVDGKYIVVHEFNHANKVSQPYMRTGTLPLTFEVENTGTPSSPSYLYIISAKVACEGKFTPREWTQGGTSEPHELISDGSGLTIDIVETIVDGILTDAEVSINAGGTDYVVGDTVTVTGGNADAVIEVTSVASGVVDGITVTDGGTGYADDTAVVTTYNRRYKPLVSIRSAELLSGMDNRAVSIPITLHITDVSGGTDPYQIEFVKNDTLNGSVSWIDQYPNNALESSNPTVSNLLTSTGGEVILTHVAHGHEDLDLTRIFGLQSQLIIRKADITAEPDHYTVRIKPAKPTGSVELIGGLVWKEYR